MKLRTTVRIGVLTGLSTAMMALVKISLPFLPPFLKYDPSDIFALVGGLIYGPLTGVLIVALKNLMHMIVRGNFAVMSHLANFVAGGTLVFVTSQLYARWRGRPWAWAALLAGSIAMALVMIPANYLLFLPYRGITGEQARQMAIFSVTPFNFVKGVLSGGIGYLLFLRVQPFLAAVEARPLQPLPSADAGATAGK